MHELNDKVVERILNNVRYYGSTPSPWLRGVSVLIWTMIECSRNRKNIQGLQDIVNVYTKISAEIAHKNGVATTNIERSTVMIMNGNINEVYKIIEDIIISNEDMHIGIAIMAEYFKWNCNLAQLFYMEDITIAEVYKQLCSLCIVKTPKYGYKASMNRLSHITRGIKSTGFIQSSRDSGKAMTFTVKLEDARGYTLDNLIEESRTYYKVNNSQLYIIPPLNILNKCNKL